jgi:cell division protein FtsI/penicillin-binding protein 2
VLTIEEGGFGAESAAPAVKQIFEAYFAHQLKEEAKEGEPSEPEATVEEAKG